MGQNSVVDDRPGEQPSARDRRTQSFWDLHPFESGRGIEVGPLFRPLVRRHEADVRYVDITHREALVDMYREHKGMPVDDIVDVDYPLTVDGVVRSMAEVAGADAPFDWVVASHVIEHVPDLVGWLDDLAELVVDDGALVLAVPDKRYSFDLHRPPTTVGAMLQAHRDGDALPSVRAVYDHYREAVETTSVDLWAGALPGYDARIHDDEEVARSVELAASVYTDCHVWIFTPEVFLAQMVELRRAGLSTWYVDRLEPTGLNQLEFLVRMRRIAREQHAASAVPPGEIEGSASRPEWMDWREEAASAAEEVARLRTVVKRQRRRILRQRRRIERQADLLQRQQRAAGLAARVRAAGGRLRRWVRPSS